MFNDERITIENGKMKKNSLFLMLIFTFCFLVGKISYYSSIDKVLIIDVIYEGFLLFSLLIVFILRLFDRSSIKDEAYYMRKTRFYNLAFKIVIYTSLFVYAAYIPIYALYGNKILLISSSYLVGFLILFTLGYSFIYMRGKDIYINYSIIQKNFKDYFIGILKNVFKLGVLFSILFLITIIFSLANIDLFTFREFMILLLGYLISFVVLAIEYMFFSLLEKSNYNESLYEGVSKSAIIAKALGMVLTITTNVVVLTINIRNIESSIVITRYLIALRYIGYLSFAFSLIACVYLYHDVKNYIVPENLLRTTYILYIISFIYSIAISLLTSFLSLLLISNTNDIKIISRFSSASSLVSIIISMICLVLLVIICNKNNTCKKTSLSLLIASLAKLLIIAIIVNSTSRRCMIELIYSIFKIIIVLYMLYANKKSKNRIVDAIIED